MGTLARMVALAVLCFGCTGTRDAGHLLGPIAPARDIDSDVSDPDDPGAALSGTLILAIKAAPSPHVYNMASTTQKAARITINVNASITARNANQGGGAGATEVSNPKTCTNSTLCQTFDYIPDYCSPDASGMASGATAFGTGTYHAEWRNTDAHTSKTNFSSCPAIKSGGGSGTPPGGDSGGGGTVCYEAWLVWPDQSQPDEFLGIVCFNAT
jgi:hypothetical protein